MARKITVGALCALFVIALAWLISIELHYFSKLPTNPDYSLGRVHQIIVSHGSVRFATQGEVDRLRFAKIWAAIGSVCGIIAGFLNLAYRDFAQAAP